MTRTPLTRLPERNLDVLRAGAVLLVLLDHLAYGAGYGGVLNGAGRAGVLLFFVHTSLVLMSSIERAGTTDKWIRTFYVRRAFRIYPLAIATVAIVVMASVPRVVAVIGQPQDYIQPTWQAIVSNFALVQNGVGQPSLIVVLWSLPIEVQMYLLLPFCFVAARRGPVLIIALFIATSAIAYLRKENFVPGLWRFTPAEFAPCFLAGVLAYAILRRRNGVARPARISSRVWIPLLVVTCAAFFVLWKIRIPAMPLGWVFCLGVGVAIPFVRDADESMLARGAHVIARYSYGIYLLHMIALWAAFTFLSAWNPVIQWAGAIALMVALPLIAYYVVERPGIELGGSLVNGREIAVAAVPAP